MDLVEPFVALVIYPTAKDVQGRQAANLARIASEMLHPQAYWLRQHATIDAS